MANSQSLNYEEMLKKDMRLGICVKNGRTGGELEIPPRPEPAREFTLIWHPEEGLVGLFDKKINRGTWVRFTLSDKKGLIIFAERKLADEVEETSSRRPVVLKNRTLQVVSIVRSLHPFNDYFGLAKDPLLGWVLLVEDPFVQKQLNEHAEVKLAVVFKEDFVRGFHWAAIAVNERTQDGNDMFRKLEYLPRFLNDLALQQGYQPREKVFADRKKLRNPLVMLMSSGLGRLSDDLKEQIREESYYGQRYGFEKDYVQDVNACQMKLTCLIVYAHERAALAYNKEVQIVVIRRCDFESQDSFDTVCQLGNWVVGNFTRPYLSSQFGLKYNAMPTKNHHIELVPPPAGLQTRIRYYRGYYAYKSPQRIVMIKLNCHFVSPNVKRVRMAFMQGEGGVILSTKLGNLYIDSKYYKEGNFEGKHLALWASFLPMYIKLMDRENCFWHFVTSLADDPHAPGKRMVEADEVPMGFDRDEAIYTSIASGTAYRHGLLEKPEDAR